MKRRIQRTERKAGKRRRSTWPVKRKQVAPRTAQDFFAKSEAFQDKWIRITEAVSKMRAEGKSLAQASEDAKLTPHTVLRWGRTALRKGANGRYMAKASDRLLRVMVVLTHGGKQEIAVRDSRQASLIAEHWNAADRYLATGDASGVRRLKGKSITDATGTKHRLLTDLAELDRQGNAGVLSFESIYARTA
jgi:hypothetical protein